MLRSRQAVKRDSTNDISRRVPTAASKVGLGGAKAAVSSNASNSSEAKFDPEGKTFAQRLAAFLADAKETHSTTIRKNSSMRTKEWQQKFHVAHMFLYNKYKSTKPANTVKGKRTISWDHFSDASTVWDTVKFSDFLRTKDDRVPVKNDKGAWKEDLVPDQVKTKARVKAMQKSAGIGNSGAAMVSSGLKPCKSPCACKAGRSKHVSGVAEDLLSSDLDSLTLKLKTAKVGSLDDYLKTFELHRPLRNHSTSPEPWHIESL